MTAAECDLLNRQRLVAHLLSAAIHDARNGLQSVSGTAELLGMGIGGSAGGVEVADKYRLIQRQAAWVGERLDHLLQIQRPAAFQLERLDAGRLWQRAVDQRHASWGRMRIRVAAPPPTGVVVHADAHAVTRVFLNLLVNAEAALAGMGGGSVAVTMNPSASGVSIVVEDSGAGVGEAEADALFTATSATGSLTTGLAASRWLLEQMGGSLQWLGPGRPAAFEVGVPSGR